MLSLLSIIEKSDFRVLVFGNLQNKGTPSNKGSKQPFTQGSQETPLYK